MIEWQEFINVIGKTEISAEFLNLLSSMQEKPEISENLQNGMIPKELNIINFLTPGFLSVAVK